MKVSAGHNIIWDWEVKDHPEGLSFDAEKSQKIDAEIFRLIAEQLDQGYMFGRFDINGMVYFLNEDQDIKLEVKWTYGFNSDIAHKHNYNWKS